MHVTRPFRFVALCTAFSVLAPAISRAADKKACLAAYEDTQKLRKSGKLIEAKDKALVCAQDGCPASLRDDCTSWTVEIEKALPSIVLVVTEADGRDVTDATAYVDGEKVTSHVEGKAIALNPGAHKVKVERAGYDTIEQDIVAHEGDKNRPVTVKFPKKGEDEPTKAATDPNHAAPTKIETTRPIPTLTWVFGGLAVAGFVGFAAFGLSGQSKKSQLETCKPTCPQNDVDATKQSFLLADVSLGVGVVGAALAIVFYATRPEEPVTKTSMVPRVDVALGPRTGASLTWSF